MAKIVRHLHDVECHLFKTLNQHFDRKWLNFYFRTITHFGGAAITISSVLLLMFLITGNLKATSYASAFALALSHIPVAIAKKIYPRKRPYLELAGTKVLENPLQDHSFPSGHSTAVFSVITPIILSYPASALVLLPIGCSVGLSRIYLGLHYPTDVLAGMVLGTSVGFLSFALF
ncbi:phosphatase PAP2 family protein [Bacillus songklensis]|uniref:Phosphatase PAP2 family protein n=1 Tax=Bacillus songklensis TaxID=1069116 RepID=A0ABV8B5Z8_9BACI